jgi:hypothetical protein
MTHQILTVDHRVERAGGGLPNTATTVSCAL